MNELINSGINKQEKLRDEILPKTPSYFTDAMPFYC